MGPRFFIFQDKKSNGLTVFILIIQNQSFKTNFQFSTLNFQLSKLFLGFFQQFYKPFVGVHTCHGGGGHQTCGIHVALPVVAGNNTALSELIATGQQGVGIVGITKDCSN